MIKCNHLFFEKGKKMTYPLYLMRKRIGGVMSWQVSYLSLADAGKLYASGWKSGFEVVQFGQTVLLDSNHSVREMTDEDCKKIWAEADKYSANKKCEVSV